MKDRKEFAPHHKILGIIENIDITKFLGCSKVVGNNIPSIFQDLIPANDDVYSNFYLKHHIATQEACYGDTFLKNTILFRVVSFL